MKLLSCAAAAMLAVLVGMPPVRVALAAPPPVFSLAGRYNTGLAATAAESVAFGANRLFVTNSTDNSLDIVDIANPAAPALIKRVSLAAYGAGPNSVDVYQSLVAVAVEANPKTAAGRVVFFDTNGTFLSRMTMGALPDMLTFTPDGKRLIVANEGEPNSYGQPDSHDPEGTVGIITLSLNPGAPRPSYIPGTLRTVNFRDFNVGGTRHPELPAGVRIFGPGASVAQDLEPEFVAVSPDSRLAYVTLQEANAVAEIQLSTGAIVGIRALGLKDHNVAGAGIDASDQDTQIRILPWQVKGMYMPDAIASLQAGPTTYYLTANEGDSRDYTGFNEESRVNSGSYVLDPTAFPNAATLKQNANLGRLTVTKATGDTDGDGDFDQIHVFGARSFSIWNAASGALVWDSGDRLEQITAAAYPANFNADNAGNAFDNRSDNKGPEPEGIAIGVIDGRSYAFVALERIGGAAVFDVTDPLAPAFVQYVNNRIFTQSPPGPDSGAEIVRFIPAAASPIGKPLVLLANEISGSVSIFRAD